MLSAPDIWYACVHLEEDVSAYIHLQEDMSAGVHGEEAALAGHGMNLERRCPRRSRGRASPPPPRPAAKVSIEMIRWTGLAPWEFEFPFPGSLTSTSLHPRPPLRQLRRSRV